jgi:hypothetical protein
MLTENQMDMYADVLLWGLKKARTETFEAGDVVMVQFDLPALAWPNASSQQSFWTWGFIR